MDLARESLALVLVFGLLGTALWFLRQKGSFRIERKNTGGARLESRGKLALTAQHSIHLIRAGDRELILALHPAGVTFLGDAAGGVAPGTEEELRMVHGDCS
ncbi:MAG TPA: flagellar biosynthetic protein FliO [Verrucomicrobiae bacterium]|nr:flagellar biosynthetic protein FliO [Verrucomicrobiae bacterium]